MVNPVPIAPTLQDLTDITIAVNLNGNARPQAADAADDQDAKERENDYKQRILKFIEELSHRRREKDADWGFFEVIHHSLETMQDTITRLKLAAYSPDVIINIPKNACGPFEFYRAAEMIALGRRMAAQALTTH